MAMDVLIKELHERVKHESGFVDDVTAEIRKVIVGQELIIDRLLIGLLADGHILLEGVPGLAKTLSVKSLAGTISAGFQRIQFTPDLLPADLIGTMVYNQKTGEFAPHTGPIFSNIILADEINRAPAKVQSALLEAMQERQVTIGKKTFKLEEPFLVLATQNPIEQEGTYPLPEAQVDRFMLKALISYPSEKEERQIIDLMTTGQEPQIKPVVAPERILEARKLVNEIYMEDKLKDYIVNIVFATRFPAKYKLNDLTPMIEYGASPRASIYITTAAKTHAFLRHRGYVIPDDIKTIAPDVLRHRIILTYEAEAQEKTTDDIVKTILDSIEVP
ncbi:MAG: AAA family ATPase [Candidatus Coatesbacteria bacterium]|nr:AAA family ATPase [Candidatus Coatesbacteria bacterium]